jgi:REP element-mobilizing transposase RayT
MWCDQLRRVSQFCGVKVLTYAVLDNHFHILVYVPRPKKISDAELVERYRALYPNGRKRVAEVEATLAKGEALAEALRARLHARMHDVSMFLKELKQRFTMWFNARFKLYGTIWAERFKSILIENDASALCTVGAYIDLNPLRAGIVEKPEDYRWCGMAAAERGDPIAQAGLISMMRSGTWIDAWKSYRRFVYHAGLRQVKDKPHATLHLANVHGIIAGLSLMVRQKSLSSGWIVGSSNYVREQWQEYHRRHERGS